MKALITALGDRGHLRGPARVARTPNDAGATTPAYGQVLVFGLLISFGLALFVAPFACSWPDGLDKVAQTLGFEHHAAGAPLIPSPIRRLPVARHLFAAVATSLAGVIGTIVVFILAFLLARVLVPKPAPDPH